MYTYIIYTAKGTKYQKKYEWKVYSLYSKEYYVRNWDEIDEMENSSDRVYAQKERRCIIKKVLIDFHVKI